MFIKFFCLLILLLRKAHFADYVPLYIWGTQTLEAPQYQGKKSDNYLGKILQKSLIVFVEPVLACEDFLERYEDGATVYSFLSQVKYRANQLYIPMAEDPVHLLSSTNGSTSNVIRKGASDVLNRNFFNSSDIFMYYFDDYVNMTKKDILQYHDTIMRQVYLQLGGISNLLFAYTGSRSPKMTPRNVIRFKKNMHVITEDRLLVDKNVLLYLARGVILKQKGKIFTIDLPQEFGISIYGREDGVELINVYSKELTFQFARSTTKNFWSIESLKCRHEMFHISKIRVPYGRSYVYKDETFRSVENNDVILKIPMMQVEIFRKILKRSKRAEDSGDKPNQDNANERGNEFSQGQNKPPLVEIFIEHSYLTVGILTGICIIMLMLIVLFTSIAMIMDIKTPEKFDNPKGKPLLLGQIQE